MNNVTLRRRMVACLCCLGLIALSSIAPAQEAEPKVPTPDLQARGPFTSGAFYDPTLVDYWNGAPLGMTHKPVDAALRSQLKLPQASGLIVTGVLHNSPAAKAGVRNDDVLLTANGRPLSKSEDLEGARRASKGEKLTLELVRQGSEMSLSIGLPPDATLPKGGLFPIVPPTYRLGVSATPADRTLRSQLKLPKGQGLVVTEVVKDSAAMKAGVQQHDVLLSLADKPVGTLEELRNAVNATEGKSTSCTLVRGGERLSLDVTPIRQPTAPANLFFWNTFRAPQTPFLQLTPPSVQWGTQAPWSEFTVPGWGVHAPAVGNNTDLNGKLDQMLGEIERLRKAVEQLRTGSDEKKPESGKSK